MNYPINNMAASSANLVGFQANPNAVMQQSPQRAIAIINQQKTCFYAVPPALFERMADAMEDLALLTEATTRLNHGQLAETVSLGDL